MADDDTKKPKKRGPKEPPPLVIKTDDPLGTLRKVLQADPDKAKQAAQRPRRKPKGDDSAGDGE